MKRTLVIGDLHGCYDEALDWLEAAQATGDDRVIFLGDLVDRGPKPRECVELAMQHESVRGNHEKKHLQYEDGTRDQRRMHPAHAFTRSKIGKEHYDFFKTMPLKLALPEYNAAVVHAGAFPQIPLDEQKEGMLLHIQNICPAESTETKWPSKAPAHWRFWTNFWQGPQRLIFGHTVLSKPLVTEFAVGLDTGAVFGRGLSGLVLPDWKVITVPSRNPSVVTGRKITQYPVQDDIHAYS